MSIILGENIDPALRDALKPASLSSGGLSPVRQKNGEIESKADFSARLYVHVPNPSTDLTPFRIQRFDNAKAASH
jgi:hypothetical protein